MQATDNTFTVIVTYGNAWPNQRWARDIQSFEDAKLLKQGAIDKGFEDAEIWREKDFQKFLKAKERVRAAACGDDRGRW